MRKKKAGFLVFRLQLGARKIIESKECPSFEKMLSTF